MDGRMDGKNSVSLFLPPRFPQLGSPGILEWKSADMNTSRHDTV